jgi:hypothetical protein
MNSAKLSKLFAKGFKFRLDFWGPFNKLRKLCSPEAQVFCKNEGCGIARIDDRHKAFLSLTCSLCKKPREFPDIIQLLDSFNVFNDCIDPILCHYLAG